MGPQYGADPGTAHVVERLAEYFSGALSGPDELAVDAHLLHCADCRAEFDDLGTVALMMAALPPGALDEPDRAALGRGPGAPAPLVRQTPGPDRSRPPGRPDRPGAAPRSRRRILEYAAVLVLGLGVGAGGWYLIDRAAEPPLAPAGSTQPANTDKLNVTLAPRPDGRTEVRAVVVGLRAGGHYQLIAVDVGSRSYVAAQGVAAGGVESITGVVAVPADTIAFIALAQDGNGVVLAVRPT